MLKIYYSDPYALLHVLGFKKRENKTFELGVMLRQQVTPALGSINS